MKKLLTFFLFLFFIFSLFFIINIPNVKGATSVYSTSLEGYGLSTQQYDDGILKTEKQTGQYSYLSTTAKRTGTLGYYNTYSQQIINWFNFTLPSGIVKYELYLAHLNLVSWSNLNIDFLNDSGSVITSFSLVGFGGNVNYNDNVGAKTITTYPTATNFYKLSFEFMTNGSVKYMFNAFTKYGDYKNVPFNASEGITKMKIWKTTTGGGTILAIDDIKAYYSSEFVDYYDLDKYCSGGSLITYQGLQDMQFIEQRFNVPFTGTVMQVSLGINNDQLNQVSDDLTDYHMWLNEVDYGNPIEVIYLGRSQYQLFWLINATFDNEYLLFTFGCDKYVSYGGHNMYWYGIGVGEGSSLFTTSVHGDSYQASDSKQSGVSLEGFLSFIVHRGSVYYINDYYDLPDARTLPSLVASLDLCFYFEGNVSMDNVVPIPPFDLEKYVERYGDFFIEFYSPTLCYYGVNGLSPILVYNLSSDYIISNSTYYRYEIYYAQTGLMVYSGLLSLNQLDRSGYIYTDYDFGYTGQYYIVLHNTTFYGTVNSGNIYNSKDSITVCDSGTGGSGIGETSEGDDYGGYGGIYALCIIMGFIIAPVILFRTNQFFINNGTIVVALFGIIGLGICISFNLVELWFAFLIALIIVGILFIKIYQMVEEGRGK